MSAVFTEPGYRQAPERKSMHRRIVHDLGQSIVNGQIKVGERLPLEAELCARYEVSRPVLREAVRVLGAKGLVRSRQKAGATVRPRQEWHLLDPDVLYWLIQSGPQAEFVQTLMTVRRIFEPAAAELAALAATPQDLQAIHEAYQGMAEASSPQQLLEPDVAFHRCIAEATHNDLLAYIGRMLSMALRESIKLSSQATHTHALSLPRHKAILTALENRDPLAARQATLLQLQSTEEDLSALLLPQSAVRPLKPSPGGLS